MNQLGDLEKILSAAKEIGENFQKELSTLRDENELLKVEMEELRDENKILRDENEKIYLEMNNLRQSKEDIKVANEAFSNNLNQLVTHLENNHQKTMEQINQVLNAGLQKFVADYMQKFHPAEENNFDETEVEENPEDNDSDEVTEVNTLEKYSDNDGEVIVENVETAVATNDSSKKNKIQYAAFYAEEAGVEKDDAAESPKMKNFNKSYR